MTTNPSPLETWEPLKAAREWLRERGLLNCNFANPDKCLCGECEGHVTALTRKIEEARLQARLDELKQMPYLGRFEEWKERRLAILHMKPDADLERKIQP